MSTTGEIVHVLYVDKPDAVDIAATALEREDDGFVVETATGVAAALDRLADLDVDCIVSDYDMPEMDGLEFLAAVRAGHPDLPFILFTGKGSEEIASRAVSAGVTDYIRTEAGIEQYAVLADRIRNAVSRYRSRQGVETSQQRLSLFIEQSPLGVIEYNSDFEIVGLNRAGEEILGYSESELRGETWERIVADTSYESVDEVTSALAEAEGGYHSIDENVRKDGERIVCEWHNHVVTDDDGDVIAVFSQFQDVTEQRERRRRIEALHEATRELMAASSQEAVADRAVETARNVLGLPINSVYLYDEDENALVPAATTEEALDLIGEPPVYESGESLSWEAFTSGEVRVFEDVSDQPGRYNPETAFGAEIILPLGDDGVMYVAATEPEAFDDADITLARTLAANTEQALSRIEREETLRESRRRYRTLVGNFPDGAVFLFNDDLEYVIAGGAELSSVGLSAGDFEGNRPQDLFPPDIAEETAHHYRETLEGRCNTFEQEYQGEQYRVRTLPVRDDAGSIVSGIAVSKNVTERKARARELARQNERLEEFAGVISHDLRNPLRVADGRVELIRQECQSDHIDDVAQALDRMDALIEDVLTLAREGDQVDETEPVGLANVAKDGWQTVSTEQAVLEAGTLPTVEADRSRLRQLFENLYRNAVEHGGDDVAVSVGAVDDGFYVADTGPGIAGSDREEIFEVGYSTNEGGTGFGLRIVEQIVDAHGWEIAVTESEQDGARFEITGVEFVDR
ncbi:MAG: PAS domain S-box protein [Haloplanus sp.]